ncbi:MAG: pyridoxal phosphate-dependent aminotransferase [Oscillospiraceae bacterium]|nr:pyridoxal phosphate-dependent aminotransferase [Oscillospiraceae bacterium]
MFPETYLALGKNRNMIRELFEYGLKRGREIGPENVYDFTLGNPSVLPPEAALKKLADILANEDPMKVFGYTSAPGDLAVLQQLSESLNSRFNAGCAPDRLYCTVGAAAALAIALRAILLPGEECVVLAPYFPEYKVFIEAAGGVMRLVPADTEAFQIPFDEFEKAIGEKTKAVILNSPNNPSGVICSPETLTKMAAILKAKESEYGHPIYLISDEPYRELVYTGQETPWLPDFYDDTVVCYSYSKSMSMPGARIGYIFTPPKLAEDREIYAAVCGAGRAMGYVNAPTIFQRLIAACDGEVSDLSTYRTNRALLLDGLRELGYTCVEPGGAFYLFPKALEPDDLAFCEKAKALDLLIVPGTGFGCPGFFRIAYCVPTERVKRSLAAFRKLAESYR